MAWRGFRPRGDTGLRRRIDRVTSVSLGNKGRCPFSTGGISRLLCPHGGCLRSGRRGIRRSLGLAVGRRGGERDIIPPGWQENAHLCLAAGGKALYEP